jgi:hypothetical protein
MPSKIVNPADRMPIVPATRIRSLASTAAGRWSCRSGARCRSTWFVVRRAVDGLLRSSPLSAGDASVRDLRRAIPAQANPCALLRLAVQAVRVSQARVRTAVWTGDARVRRPGKELHGTRKEMWSLSFGERNRSASVSGHGLFAFALYSPTEAAIEKSWNLAMRTSRATAPRRY